MRNISSGDFFLYIIEFIGSTVQYWNDNAYSPAGLRYPGVDMLIRYQGCCQAAALTGVLL